MQTVCATGVSAHARAEDAAGEACAVALAALAGRTASFALVFASPAHSLSEVMARVDAELPGVEALGCTTAGQFDHSGVVEPGCLVLLISSGEHVSQRIRAIDDPSDPALAAQTLLDGSSSVLVPPTGAVLLGDGLSPSLEKVVVELLKRAELPRLAGAGAGDGDRLQQTFVAHGEHVMSGGLCAAFFHGKRSWGVGVAHGLVRASDRMIVTRASGNVVQEIDGRPAVEAYEAYASARGDAFDRHRAGRYMIQNELGILLFEDPVRMRAPLAVGEDGSLICAGSVPEGAAVCIVRADAERMVAAARDATAAAVKAVDGDVAAVLVFSCVCRLWTLGDDYQREVEAIVEIAGGAPVAGMLSYGEVAISSGHLEGYHNDTIVVAAVPT